MDGARVLFKRGSSLLSRSSSRSQASFAGINTWKPCSGKYMLAPSIVKRYGHVYSADRGMMGTTVLCIRKDDAVVIIGDGQVTIGSEIIKPNVRKVRRIGENVIGGFAGATADAFTLFERLEAKLEEHPGQLTRAAVELAKAWRTDKFLRRLDAIMVVADSEISLTITGNGDVLEPHDGVVGIGSGGAYAAAAARALIDIPNMDAETIAYKAMKIAADCCIYTNHNFTIERISVSSTRSPEAESQAASISIPVSEGSPDSNNPA
ncbi:hypothetical protein O6H91_18G055100 [Diphasiastrum complanatum]|uniref:Uncharacterized protein n=1 Tax=Diphasiastrum complanatum TaxID=34168 RepID=A0ACC2B1I1_DIPCM|nr:hypothetical protein O6H91_18G055100 [Diphasiastrum complanatum]